MPGKDPSVNYPFKKRKPSVFERQIHLAKKKLFFVRVKIFLLIVLPISIITLGKAVIHEYAKIRLRQIASSSSQDKAAAESQKRTGKP